MPKKYCRLAYVYQLTFVFLIIYSVETKADGLEQYFPAYAVAAHWEILSNSTCRNELVQFRNGVDRKIPWSLKVLDASGQPESGFAYGNNYWLGSKSQCLDLENTTPLELDPEFLKNTSKSHSTDEEFPPFHLNYFIANFHHNSTLQYQLGIKDEGSMLLGLCLPASCSSDQIGEILKKVLGSKSLAIGNLYSTTYRFDGVRCTKDDDYQWLLNWQCITTGTVFILTIILTIVGTSYDCIVHQKRLEMINNSKSNANDAAHSIQPNTFGKILLCFSAYTNTNLILDTTVNKDTVISICGLRFLGMLWVSLIHTYIFLSDIMKDQITPWRISQTLVSQIISNSGFSVDIFFCISGFLISWSYFSKKANRHSEVKPGYYFPWTKYLKLIFTRIIRIAPIYFLMIGTAEIILGWYRKTTSFIPARESYENCTSYWWKNVLFIQNFYSWNGMCLSWTWYLAVDMQFYVIGTFLLLLSDVYFYGSAFLLMILLITSAVISGVSSYLNGYTATYDQTLQNLEIYLPPWMRIGPYLVGMIAGYILMKCNGKLDLSRKTLTFLWIIGGLCNISTLFGLYGGSIPLIRAAVYVALSRIAWGLGIAWIMIACHTNNAGFINKILSLRIWIFLSKLTYCAYILSPLALLLVVLTSESSLYMNAYQLTIYFLGSTVLVLFVAFVVNVIFAIPFLLLSQVIFGL